MTDITWIDKDTSYPCVMVRNSYGGHLCGYVLLPAAHPVNGMSCADIISLGVEVHGGLTYSDSAESLGGMSSEWALGFDCGHMCDRAAPKDEEYVRTEVTKLAQQLKTITDEQVTLHYATLAPAPASPYTRESTLATIDAATRLSEQIEDSGKRQTFDMALRVANAELEMGNLEQAVKVVLKAVMFGGVTPIELP